MNSFLKISAPEIYAVPIQDNGEPLINVLDEYPDFFIDQSRKHSQKISRSFSFLRKGVAERLKLATQYLPDDIHFMIIEGYRSLEVQQAIFIDTLQEVRTEHPDWTQQQVYEKTSTFVAPPDNTPPHSTGGAIDLTLITIDGTELDMGTDLNDGYSGTCYTFAQSISQDAKKNRLILIQAMERAGFVNYPAEWWHWSYGDRYWAHLSSTAFAIYGSK